MKYSCIEQTIEINVSSDFKIRIWFNLKDMNDVVDEEILSELEKEYLHNTVDLNVNSILEKISKLPNVNAVQVISLNEEGFDMGKVVYLVDFDTKG